MAVNYSPLVSACGGTHAGYDHAYLVMQPADDNPHGDGFK